MNETYESLSYDGIPLLGMLGEVELPLVESLGPYWRFGALWKGNFISDCAHIPVFGFQAASFDVESGQREQYVVAGDRNMDIGWEGDFPAKKSARFGTSYQIWTDRFPKCGQVVFRNVTEESHLVIWNGYKERGSLNESVANNCLTWKQIGPHEWRMWAHGGTSPPTMKSVVFRVKLIPNSE